MDKMREEFEAWYAEQFKYSDKLLNRHGETYLSPFVGGLWSSWKASRAAICVELPRTPSFSASDEPDLAFEEGVDVMKEIIEAVGVTCK